MGRDKVWDIQDVIFLRGGEGEKWRMGDKEMGGWGEMGMGRNGEI